MKAHRSIVRSLFAVLAATLLCPAAGEAQEIPSPEEFFGHEMGADRQLARWDRLVEYYDTLGVLSDRLIVEHVGETTLGNPFLVIYVSSPENLGKLEEAVASYHKALDIKSNFAEAHSNLGNALQDLGALDEAVASYRKAFAKIGRAHV